MIKSWLHLQCVANQLLAFKANLEIGVFVVIHSTMANKPLEVRPTSGSDIFVICPAKLVTGGQFHLTYNRIVIQESFTEVMNPASSRTHVGISFQQAMFTSYPDEKAMSHEDVKLLKNVKHKDVFKDVHYTVVLPFREADVIQPNNKTQTLKRALWQTSKFIKDDKYCCGFT